MDLRNLYWKGATHAMFMTISSESQTTVFTCMDNASAICRSYSSSSSIMSDIVKRLQC